MANETRQVQKGKASQRGETDAIRLLRFLASSGAPYITDKGTLPRRPYPFRWQGECLAERLNRRPSTTKENRLLTSVRILQEVARAMKNRDISAIDKLRKRKKGLNFAYDYLGSAAIAGKGKHRIGEVHEHGLTVRPSTDEGHAALAALVLEKENKIDRIKQCLNCKDWFYAIFKHQRFCNYPGKNCQWNHYHTPEWRKKHREQNRRHQAEWRKRTFSKHPLRKS
jgi:hypothetical protein